MKSYILSPNYILQTVGEDTILLPCGNENEVDLSKMIVLNETSAFIISCMENSAIAFEQLIQYMENSFDETTDRLREDVTEFLDDMVAKKIVCIQNEE